MDILTPEILDLLKWVLGAAVIYGGIRQDIKNIHEKINDVKSESGHAHARLDRHLEIYHTPDRGHS